MVGVGHIRVPDMGLPLRDSGSNTPGGGLTATDVRGLARVTNSVVDRGAVEAQSPTNSGPTVTALNPVAGGTTVLPATSGPFLTTRIFFLTQSGTGAGQTTVDWEVTAGNGVVTVRPLQTVCNGGLALPVDVAIDNSMSGGGNVQAPQLLFLFVVGAVLRLSELRAYAQGFVECVVIQIFLIANRFPANGIAVVA